MLPIYSNAKESNWTRYKTLYAQFCQLKPKKLFSKRMHVVQCGVSVTEFVRAFSCSELTKQKRKTPCIMFIRSAFVVNHKFRPNHTFFWADFTITNVQCAYICVEFPATILRLKWLGIMHDVLHSSKHSTSA